MLSVLALFLGFTGMLGFWGLAWWLLKQPVLAPAIEARPRPSRWQNEPTGGRGLAPAPVNRMLENPDEESVPNRRVHDSSDSNTQFFSRTDINRRENVGEETEIILDGPPSAERTEFLTNPFPEPPSVPPSVPPPPPRAPGVPPPPPPPKVGSRKTWLLGSSGPPKGR